MMSRRDDEIERRMIREERGPCNQRELLAVIRRRPAMFLGKKSLEVLDQFLSGYAFACRLHDLHEAKALGHLCDQQFERWLAEKKNLGTGSSAWSHHLLMSCQDDALAFDRFFELLDEFEQSLASEEATATDDA